MKVDDFINKVQFMQIRNLDRIFAVDARKRMMVGMCKAKDLKRK